MISVCPDCGARFALPDDAFANGPRRLRCAQCSCVWRSDASGLVMPEPPRPPSNTIPVAGQDLSKAASPASRTTQASKSSKPRSAFWLGLEKLFAFLPRMPRRLGWFLTITLLVLAILVLWFGRYRLVTRFDVLEAPMVSAGLIHIEALDNLDIKLTRAEKCLIAGRDMLCLSGTVTNHGAGAMGVPTLYVAALDAVGQPMIKDDGKTPLSWTVPPETVKLLPGESRSFSLTEPYPNRPITDFDYGFVDDSP